MKKPNDSTKEQLIRDLSRLHSRIAELEQSAAERMKHQEELVRSRAMYEALFEFAPDAIVAVERDGTISRVNKQAEILFGYSRDELLNIHHEMLLPRRLRKIHEESRWEYMTRPRIRPMGTGLELYGRRKDGTEFSVDIALGPLKAGDDIVVMAVVRDVSAHRQAEDRYRTLFDAIDQGFCIVEVMFDEKERPVDYRFLEVNRSFEKQTGLVAAQGKRMRELAPGHEEHWFATYGKIALTGQPERFQHRAEQLHRWYDVYAFRVGKPEDRQVGILFSDITGRKESEDVLKLTKFSVDHASVSAFLIGKDARILYVNEQACRSLGYSCEELLAMTIPDLDPYYSLAVWYDAWGRLQKAGSLHLETAHRRKDGTLMPVAISANYISFGGKEYNWAYGIDISERKRGEETLRESEERFRAFFELAAVGAVEADPASGRFLRVNDRFCEFIGFSREELLSKAIPDVTHPDDRARDAAYFAGIRKGGTGYYNVEKRYIHKDGRTIWGQVSASIIRDRSGTPIRTAGIIEDITERKRMEEEISHLAHHDALTGLPNRRLFRDIADIELAQARRNRKKLAILFLDLDRFKEINDTLGHEAGDALLKQAAGLFRDAIRASDTVARIGGDEFNIILSDIARPEDVNDIAKKIISRFRSPFSVSGNELDVTTSIGISVYPDDSAEIDSLLRYADIAMYHAKESGRNTFRFYNPAINVRSLDRIRLESSLRQSLERGELEVFYQPQVDLKSGRIVSAEALVRWRHPDRGVLEPTCFIRSAEDIGFISSIDEYVFASVCAEIRSLLDSGLAPVGVAVNLSARAFQDPELVDRIVSTLRQTGIPPEYLDVEITETLAMSNIERTISRLSELAELGVHAAIDDFGTGYSSLNYLKRLPIQKLKIDQSFIKDIAVSHDDRSIISAVTAMAHSMSIRVLAEGVETEEQLSFIRSTECDEAQGFLFSRPVASREFRELIAQRA